MRRAWRRRLTNRSDWPRVAGTNKSATFDDIGHQLSSIASFTYSLSLAYYFVDGPQTEVVDLCGPLLDCTLAASATMTSLSLTLLAVMTSSLVGGQSYITSHRGRYLPHRKFTASRADRALRAGAVSTLALEGTVNVF